MLLNRPTDNDLASELIARLLRPAEVAEQLQVSRRTVYNLIARGDLKPCRIGGAIRVHPGDLAEYVARLRRISLLPDMPPVGGG